MKCSRPSCYKENPDWPRLRTCPDCRADSKKRRDAIRARAEADPTLCTRCGKPKEPGSRHKLCSRCRPPKTRRVRGGPTVVVGRPYEALPPPGLACTRARARPGDVGRTWWELV